MPIKNIGKKLNDSLHGAVDAVKTKAEEVELPDLKKLGGRASEQVRSVFHKKAADKADAEEPVAGSVISAIPIRNALKVIYYLIVVDGVIDDGEIEKFDEIGRELMPDYAGLKESIIEECRSAMECVIDPEDHYDVIRDCVENALLSSGRTEDAFITPKLGHF